MTDEIPQSKGERTRRAILEAAHTLFIEQGYHATSMRQIADRAGLALGGIYNHFASKDEIFQALIADRHPFIQIMPLLMAAPGETAEEFVRNAARSMVDELGHRPDFIKLMFIELVEFNGQHVPTLFQRIFPQIVPIMQRFMAPGYGLRPIPPPLLARAFMGMFFSFYMTEFLMGDLMPPEMRDNSLDGFVDIFLHGVLSSVEG
jgi:AcrR family transcriptional regulator